MKIDARQVYGLLIVVLLGLALGSCGAAERKALTSNAPHEEYAAFLRVKIAADKNFDFDTLSSNLIVKALVYSPEVEARARLLFHGDPLFNREVDSWRRASAGSSKTRLVVVMGLFAPDLNEKDVEEGRFRPALVMADGHLVRAADIVRYGRDSVFARNYFPVFDPWEELYAVKFDLPLSSPQGAADGFIVEWPGGVARLTLSGAVPQP